MQIRLEHSYSKIDDDDDCKQFKYEGDQFEMANDIKPEIEMMEDIMIKEEIIGDFGGTNSLYSSCNVCDDVHKGSFFNSEIKSEDSCEENSNRCTTCLVKDECNIMPAEVCLQLLGRYEKITENLSKVVDVLKKEADVKPCCKAQKLDLSKFLIYLLSEEESFRKEMSLQKQGTKENGEVENKDLKRKNDSYQEKLNELRVNMETQIDEDDNLAPEIVSPNTEHEPEYDMSDLKNKLSSLEVVNNYFKMQVKNLIGQNKSHFGGTCGIIYGLEAKEAVTDSLKDKLSSIEIANNYFKKQITNLINQGEISFGDTHGVIDGLVEKESECNSLKEIVELHIAKTTELYNKFCGYTADIESLEKLVTLDLQNSSYRDKINKLEAGLKTQEGLNVNLTKQLSLDVGENKLNARYMYWLQSQLKAKKFENEFLKRQMDHLEDINLKQKGNIVNLKYKLMKAEGRF